jgi:arylesterase/paraoxonase
MMSKKRKWFIGSAATLAVIGGYVVYTMVSAGAFREIVPQQPGECRKIEGIVGGEDLQWHPNGRDVFVAAQDRRNLDQPGHIYRLCPHDEGAAPVDITPNVDGPFHPHGLSLFIGENGDETLFVVNHHSGKTGPHSIEIFDVTDEGTLEHRRSIQDERLVSPNDVAAVGPDEFYVTNDHASSSLLMHTLEEFLQLAIGNVIFFDGQSFRQVYGGTQYANGISASHDGTEIYLAETTATTIKVFERDPNTNELERTHTVETDTGVDNIDVAPDGTLWVAGHPNMLAFLSHARATTSRSPSQVIRLQPAGDRDWSVEQVYVDDGDPISGSAVAAVHGDTLVIGPVYDPHLLVCEMN